MNVLSGEQKKEIDGKAIKMANGDDIPVAIDPAARLAQVEARKKDQEAAEERIPGLFKFLRDREAETQAERDVYAEEIRTYHNFLSVALRDRRPEKITRRRVVIKEWILDRFGRVYSDSEAMVAMLEQLVKDGCLILVELPEVQEGQQRPKPESYCHVWQYDRNGLHAYIVASDVRFEQKDIENIKAAFNTLHDKVKSKVFKAWENQAKAMQYRSTITLQEALQGKAGLVCTYVPEENNRGKHREGGWVLWSVEGVDGAKIVPLEVTGDFEKGQGFAFISAMEKAMGLRPSPFLPVHQLQYWSPFPRDRETKMYILPVWYQERSEHVSARVLMHAVLLRAIRMEHEDGGITLDVPWLRPRPQAEENSNKSVEEAMHQPEQEKKRAKKPVAKRRKTSKAEAPAS